ncbi:MAG TPA: hypothetical protein VFO74_12930, partial [Pseudolabrys sp.]|nr:hypothetical protein [Pseudolabrys sp.]
GGGGNDTAAGGSGADRFVFLANDGVAGLPEAVVDFNRIDGDKIDLSGASGAVMSFQGTAAFTAAGQVRYVAAVDGAFVHVNLDADLTPELSIKMFGVATPIAADFIL